MKITKRKTFIYSILTIIFLSFSYVKYHNMNVNDIGLKVLSWVKKVKGDGVDLSAIRRANTPTMQHGAWTGLLQKHVAKNGQVNYKGFIQDKVLLQQYLDDLNQHPPGDNWANEEKLAYWINAYNAFTIKLIIDNYPLKSIKNISEGMAMINSPWDIKFFKIGDTDFDLNTIEHEILRKDFEEPRIHFAVNCASFSCPKLRNEAFTAIRLEEQLEEQVRDFINNSEKNIINEQETKLSRIFDWFKSDFTKTSDVLTFIQKYEPALNKNNKVEYVEYDWTLNDW